MHEARSAAQSEPGGQDVSNPHPDRQNAPEGRSNELDRHSQRALGRGLTQINAWSAGKALDRLLAPNSETAKVNQAGEARYLLQCLMLKAEARGWSKKRLVAESGLSWGTFHRALAGDVDLGVWLPKIRQAAARLGA